MSETIAAIEQLESTERTTLVGRFGPQTQIRMGDTSEVAIDEGALHFFDASTGAVIHDQAPASPPPNIASRAPATAGDKIGA